LWISTAPFQRFVGFPHCLDEIVQSRPHFLNPRWLFSGVLLVRKTVCEPDGGLHPMIRLDDGKE
jgi:hypothetical protein